MKRLAAMLRLAIGALLIGAGAWLLYVAAFNWWAAGGPIWGKVEAPAYARQGNKFFAGGFALLAGGLAMVVFEVRRVVRERRRARLTPLA